MAQQQQQPVTITPKTTERSCSCFFIKAVLFLLAAAFFIFIGYGMHSSCGHLLNAFTDYRGYVEGRNFTLQEYYNALGM